MYIYFTTNDKFYSKLLKWVFNEYISHIGLAFAPTLKTHLVIECTKPYGKVFALQHWLLRNEVIVAVQIPLTKEEEAQWFDEVAYRAVLRPYDFGAYFYGFYWGLRHKFFGDAYPETNAKSDPNHDICTEVLQPLKVLLLKYGIDIAKDDLTAMTPQMVASKMYYQTKGKSDIIWMGSRKNLENL